MFFGKAPPGEGVNATPPAAASAASLAFHFWISGSPGSTPIDPGNAS